MTESNKSSALEVLRDGNRRFVEGDAKRFAAEEADRRRDLAKGQTPKAVVLTCSDSRVPPELVFDQGLGDLFVIRVAGNVVTPGQLGSIEYAVEVLGTRLVIVLGHTHCGAVTATLDEVLTPSPALSPNLRALTDQIRPAVEAALQTAAGNGDEGGAIRLSEAQRQSVVGDAIRRNVRASMEALERDSEIVGALARSGELEVVGAEYSLEDGAVAFLE